MWVEAPVVVVQALDVVLTEAGSVLDLDDLALPGTTNQCSERWAWR